MLIFFQELIMQVFLWILRAIDGIMELFSALSGITKINYRGEQINLVEFLVGDSTISKVFWCVFILAIGLGCMFAIIALVKNMLANNRNISSIVGKFFLGMLGTLVMLIVVILGIIISNSLLILIAEIFNIDTSMRLSETLFNICVGDWLNGYSVAEIDFNTITVRDILGEYDPNTVFGVFPTSWKMNGMINPNTFMYFPALLMVFGVGFALIKAIAKLVKRVYELIFMYVTMPMFMSTLPLDDGARFRTWRETFVTKVVLTYGTVFSVSIFALILPMISAMQIDGISEFGHPGGPLGSHRQRLGGDGQEYAKHRIVAAPHPIYQRIPPGFLGSGSRQSGNRLLPGHLRPQRPHSGAGQFRRREVYVSLPRK